MTLKEIRSNVARIMHDIAFQKWSRQIIDSFINQVQYKICNPRHELWFLRKTTGIITSAPESDGTVTVTQSSTAITGSSTGFENAVGKYDTGTVLVTNGSEKVTGSGTSWKGNVEAGGYIYLPDGNSYKIRKVVDDTTLLLESVYAGSTASGQSYHTVKPVYFTIKDSQVIYEVQACASDTSLTIYPAYADDGGSGKNYYIYPYGYKLPDDFRQPISVKQGGETDTIERKESKDLWGEVTDKTAQSDTATYYTIDKRYNRIIFYPILNDVYKFDIEYWAEVQEMVDDNSEPVIPEKWHELLVLGTTVKCMKIDNDKRLSSFESEYLAILQDFLVQEGRLDEYDQSLGVYTWRE